MESMTAGRLASLAHVNLQTIRYCERQGLLPKPFREPNGYRRYSSIDVARVSFIKEAQALGFSLNAVRELLNIRVDKNNACSDAKAVASRHLDDVHRRIDELRRIEVALQPLVTSCSGRGPLGECPLLHALEKAE